MKLKFLENAGGIFKKLMSKDKLLLILLFGILLIVINFPVKNNSSKKTESATKEATYEEVSVDNYVEELEKKVENVLSGSEKIGKSHVAITVKNTGKSVICVNKNTTVNKVNETDSSGLNRITDEQSIEESVVYVNEDNKEYPFVADEEMPEILGVIVSSKGADNANTISEITEAVSVLLGIPVNRIKVLKLEA